MMRRLLLAVALVLSSTSASAQIMGRDSDALRLTLTVTATHHVYRWIVSQHSIPHYDGACSGRAYELLNYAKRRLPKLRVTGAFECRPDASIDG